MGLLQTNKNGVKSIVFPPIASGISDLINFKKENLIFSGHEENDVIAFACGGRLGFLNKHGSILIDSIDLIEDVIFKMPVLPFTEFIVFQKNGSRFYFDPIHLEGYTHAEIQKACDNYNERQIAENFKLFKMASTGIKIGLGYLLSYCNENSIGNFSQNINNTQSYSILYQTEFTEVNVEYEKVNWTTIDISSTYTGEEYYSSIRIFDRDGKELDLSRKEFTDAYKDNNEYIMFDDSYGNYIEVRVSYGTVEHPLLGKPKYKGTGAIVRLYKKGNYSINIKKK